MGFLKIFKVLESLCTETQRKSTGGKLSKLSSTLTSCKGSKTRGVKGSVYISLGCITLRMHFYLICGNKVFLFFFFKENACL